MRVLAHIHTFNDADIIDRTIEAVRRQTRPVDGILVVDNASSDGTLDQPSLKNATVIRHSENLGTSGTVVTGMRYALERGYDWIWLFDADSNPEPDALRKLLELYAGWSPKLQAETGFITCVRYNVENGTAEYGGLFTPYGLTTATPAADARCVPCHFNFWSGCLYRLAVVREIGLPNADYVLDWGDGEYGYRVIKAGYKAFVDREAVLHHNIRGYETLTPIKVRRGETTVTMHDFPPIRCYYQCRNILYFMLYDVGQLRMWVHNRAVLGPASLMFRLLQQPRRHEKHLRACLRGIWHGLTGNIAARY